MAVDVIEFDAERSVDRKQVIVRCVLDVDGFRVGWRRKRFAVESSWSDEVAAEHVLDWFRRMVTRTRAGMERKRVVPVPVRPLAMTVSSTEFD